MAFSFPSKFPFTVVITRIKVTHVILYWEMPLVLDMVIEYLIACGLHSAMVFEEFKVTYVT